MFLTFFNKKHQRRNPAAREMSTIRGGGIREKMINKKVIQNTVIFGRFNPSDWMNTNAAATIKPAEAAKMPSRER